MGTNGSKQKIPPEELAELLEETHFDKKELKKWYIGFIRDCPDGKLDEDQFINLYCKFYEHGDAKKFASHVFRTFDVNSDGTIDFREFISSLSVTTRGTLEEKLHWAFQIYDIDGNGHITQHELFSILKAVYKMAGARNNTRPITKSSVQQTFNNMDTNKDGYLSLDEFIKGAKKDGTFVNILRANSTQ